MRKATVLAALLLAAAAPGWAQTYSTGDAARSAALGGGGIALPGPNVSTSVNPAALASSGKLTARMPQITAAFQGPKGQELLHNVAKNGDLDHILGIGAGLFRDRTVDWANGIQSLRWAHFEIGFGAGAELSGTPNASLRKWAQPTFPFGIPPASARYDTEYGYEGMVTLAYGHSFGIESAGVLDAGIRLIPVFGSYHRDVLRVNRKGQIVHHITNTDSGSNLAADLGFRFAPKSLRGTTFGLVGRGLLDGKIGKMSDIRTVDAGMAHQFNSKLLGTLDWLNIPGTGNRSSKGSLGAEYAVVGHWLLLRGAVTTRGLAAGIGLGPLNLSYSADGQSMVGTGFSF